MAFDETALPVLAKGKNTNIKLSEKGYNVEFILSWLQWKNKANKS